MSYLRDLDEYRELELVSELTRRAQAREQGVCDYCGRTPSTTAPCKFPDRHGPAPVKKKVTKPA